MGILPSALRTLACASLLGLPALPTAAGATSMYRFDTVHSQVLFSVTHNGYSKPMGRLRIAAGWLRFDPDHWSQAATELDIDLTSVDLGSADWNQAVQGASFFAVAQHPHAHFRSTDVVRTGADTGIIHGVLSLRGIRRPIAISFRVNRVGFTIFDLGTVAGFSGRATLLRQNFGMTRFTGSIGQRIDIRLEIEALADADARRDYHKAHPEAASHGPAQ